MDKIGVYCSSNHPKLWLNVYNNLKSQNKTEIEMMFVGDVPPKYKLPPGMKYIYSKVKPAQCYYIAATRVDGNYLATWADDVTITPGGLDNCLEVLKRYDTTKTMVTPKFGVHRMEFYGDGSYKDIVPTLTVGPVMSRDLWNQLGIDRNFVIVYWDCDQAMKVWSMGNGSKVVVCENSSISDVQIPNSVRMSNWENGYDRKLFYSMWTRCTSGEVPMDSIQARLDPLYAPLLQRQKACEPIVETPDILTVSQGPKGVWE